MIPDWDVKGVSSSYSRADRLRPDRPDRRLPGVVDGTVDRIAALTDCQDPDTLVRVLAEHDHQHMRAVATAMGLDPDDENLEETLAEALADYRQRYVLGIMQ